MECFNFKMKAHTLCIDALFAGTMTIHEICYECLTQCSKAFLLSDFHTLFFRHALHEIIFVLTKILFVRVNGEDCPFGLCFGVRYMSGVYFAHLLYSYFYFKEKLRNYNENLTRSFHGRKFYSNQLRRNDH